MEKDSIYDFRYPCDKCGRKCSNGKQCADWLEWVALMWAEVVLPFRRLRDRREAGKYDPERSS